MSNRAVLFAFAAALAACGKSDSKPAAAGKQACDRYADLEISCGKAKEGARSTILEYCSKARGGATDVMSQLIALESSCAETVADCDAYKACVEKKKAETTPKL